MTVLPITEIVSDNDFFDYEAKYLGKSQEITPATNCSAEIDRKSQCCRQTKAYEILKMSGFSRSEFILVDGEPFMLRNEYYSGF